MTMYTGCVVCASHMENACTQPSFSPLGVQCEHQHRSVTSLLWFSRDVPVPLPSSLAAAYFYCTTKRYFNAIRCFISFETHKHIRNVVVGGYKHENGGESFGYMILFLSLWLVQVKCSYQVNFSV